MVSIKNPLISVVIPTYNPSAYINDAIKSVLNQDYSNIEIIVIDDGSVVDVKSVINKSFIKKIKLYRQKNQGPSTARNYGVKKSRGDLIAFLDDDDEWFRNKLSKQISFLNNNNLDLVISGLISRESGKKDFLKKNYFPKLKSQKLLAFLLGEVDDVTPTILVKKKVFSSVKGFRKELKRKEDHYFMMSVISNNFKVGSICEPLYYRNKRDLGLSNSSSPELLIENSKIFVNLCKKELKLDQSYLNKYLSQVFVQSSYLYFLKKNLKLSVRCLKKSFKYDFFNVKNLQMIILLPFLSISDKIAKIKNKLNL